VIAVEVKNEGANSRWYSGSGIYRHVRLVLTGTAHVAQWGTFITTPEVSGGKAFVRIRTEVEGLSGTPEPLDLRTKIFDAAGNVVAEDKTEDVLTTETTHRFDQRLEVTDPALWSLERPTLYTAVSELAVARKVSDTTSQRFGIRTLHFSPEDGFKLNGEPLLLKGSCMHHDNGPLGAAAYDDAEYRRVRLTKEAGFNAIRCSHNPPSEAFLNACDQLGVLVIDEAFDIWKHGKGGSDFYAQHFDAWWQRDMDAMVLRDRNHPSVVLWSIGNEIPQNDTDPVFATARMLADYVHKLDPSRPVTAGVQGVNPKKDGYFAALDVAGYNYALKWNEGYTYQKSAYLDDHQRQPGRVIVGTESFASQAFDYWMPVVDHPWVIGDFVWTGWDYLGESSIGWIGFGYPVYWPVAYCGDISITGLRRPQSYYRGALFGDSKVAAFVMSPKPLFEHRRAFDWGFDDVQASWTWPGSEGNNLTVVVYSACDEVEVFLNDKSCGKQPTTRKERFQAHFGVPYAPGTLKAIGYKDGRALSEWKLETAGEPAALRLLPERTVLAADGQALAYIPFQVVDAEGRLHPQATNLVQFDITGPAVLAAVGSGDPSSLESFQQPQRRAYQGQGLVILKSTSETGHIRLTATSKGLKPVSIEIDSK
jgi:beta-galactosidase